MENIVIIINQKIINKIYKENYCGRKFQEKNFENFNINSENEIAVFKDAEYEELFRKTLCCNVNNRFDCISDLKEKTENSRKQQRNRRMQKNNNGRTRVNP